MARKLRVDFEGAIHHLTARGVEKRPIFDDDRDRLRFVRRLGEAVEEHGVRLYLYCLMPNHVHLVVETPAGNLSEFMHKLQTAYAVYYNVRHGRVGPLMQGRYKSKLVQGDEYLLKLSRYVHLNPVCVDGLSSASLAQRRLVLRRYPWSSFRAYAGLEPPQPFVDEAPILAMLAGDEGGERGRYERFVEDGLAARDERLATALEHSGWAVGDEGFKARAMAAHRTATARSRRPGALQFRRSVPRLDPAWVLARVAEAFGERAEGLQVRRRGCVARAVAAHFLVRLSRLSQCEVGGLLGMGSGAAVSNQLGRLHEQIKLDASLADKVASLTEGFTSAAGAPYVLS